MPFFMPQQQDQQQQGEVNFGALQGIQPQKSGVVAQGQAPAPDSGGGGGGGIGSLIKGLSSFISGMGGHGGGGAPQGSAPQTALPQVMHQQQSQQFQQQGQQLQQPGLIGQARQQQGIVPQQGMGQQGIMQQQGVQNQQGRMGTMLQQNMAVPDSLKMSPAYQASAKAWQSAQASGISKSPYMTVVDFSQPATAKRLNVINMQTGQVALSTQVTQGSGPHGQGGFSNNPGSHQSSLGTYLTGAPYQGSHGPSMRVQGLDKGINDNAASRDIVVHPADYASSGGRSWGCFGVPPQDAQKFAQLTAGGSIIHAYAPDSATSHPKANNFINNPAMGQQVLSTPGNNPFRPQQQNVIQSQDQRQSSGGGQGNFATTQPNIANTNQQQSNQQNQNMSSQLTLDTIKKFEQFNSKPAWDVNAYRAGWGSDQYTSADGSVHKVVHGQNVSQEDADRDLNRRAQQFENASAHQVGAGWQQLSPGTQSALTSLAYNHGSLPPSVVRAAKSGDPTAIAKSITDLSGWNGGSLASRRRHEAAMVQ